MVKNKFCTIYIVRHGETDWNKKKLIQGHRNIELNETGKKQAQEARVKLKDITFDQIFSSDLARAKITAEIIALNRKITIKTTQLLREKSYGNFEGKNFTFLQTELKDMLKEFETLTDESKWKYKFPTIETDEEVVSRFITFLREAALTYSNKTILVTTHAGVIGNLLIHLGIWAFKDQYTKKISNAGYLKLQSDGIDFYIKDADGIDLTKS